jgi:SAM-dependent methyltransferase
MKKTTYQKILFETEAGYDRIAEKFSQTRKHFWGDLEFLSDYVHDGDQVLDFGCGNGRLLEIIGRKEIDYSGVDVSQKLIDLAQAKYPDRAAKFSKIPGQGSLPFTDDFFNTIFSIAVFHHLPGQDVRAEVVRELYRILKPEGMVIVTVWNLWQRKYLPNLAKNWLVKSVGLNRLDWNDCRIAFKNNKGEVFHRYHHAYCERELCELFLAAGFKIERIETVSGRNIVLVAKK